MKKTISQSAKKKGAAAKPLLFLSRKCPDCEKKKLVEGKDVIQCDNCGHSEPKQKARQEMKAIVGGCEEASPSSRDFYIPCNNTAVRT